VKALAKPEALGKKYTVELMNAKLDSLWSQSCGAGTDSLVDRRYFDWVQQFLEKVRHLCFPPI
jgi:hypothetical protein